MPYIADETGAAAASLRYQSLPLTCWFTTARQALGSDEGGAFGDDDGAGAYAGRHGGSSSCSD
eukprot:COSAG05_NODE_654_length_8069_cov_3.646926_7_plen_63_part_00